MQKKRPFLLYILMVILLFLAISGIAGGAALISDPSGKSLGLDINNISKSSFHDYFFLGILLFIFNGLLPMLVAYALVKQPAWLWPEPLNIYKKQQWPWTFCLYTGLVLLIWMQVQLMIIGFRAGIQSLFGIVGLLIVILTLTPAVKKYYRKRDKKG